MKLFGPEIRQNRYVVLTGVTGLVLLSFYFTANMLYPWRGDDFYSLYQLRNMTVWQYIAYSYQEWTLRLGNVISLFVYACGSKLVFNIANAVIQTALVYLIAAAAVGRLLDLRKNRDAFLLVFTAGISFFVSRPADTVYWVPGAILYSWAAAIYLTCFILLEWAVLNKKANSKLLILLAVLGFCSGYANENVAITGTFLLACGVFFRPSKPLYFTFAGYLAGAIFLFMTPGAFKRLASVSTGEGGFSLWNMLSKIPEIICFYTASSLIPLLFLFGVLALSFRKVGKKVLCRAAFLLALSIFAALVFAGCPLPPMRSYYVCSILVMMSCCVLFDGADWSKCKRNFAIAAAVAAGLTVMLTSLPDFSAIYHDESARTQMINQAKAAKMTDIAVPEHRILRRSFLQYVFIEDIAADPQFWLNTHAARYYEVGSIRSIPSGTEVPLYRDRVMNMLKKLSTVF